MAWFYPPEKMPAVASLCALAGLSRVRDRLAWGHMEAARGRFAEPNKYDASAKAQADAGLEILQVNHSTPAWAGPDGKRFPPDLRDAFNFHREMARRWAGRVQAFEPWNEADIDMFGGHTGAEMASMQKASALGLAAGNPKATACLNVFATPAEAILDDLAANEAWPYFDTFNLHHYAAVEEYPRIYARFRAASAGRPLWVTEFARPVKWTGDEAAREPSPDDLKVQAERVAQVFAACLHEGAQAAFYFLLPHYTEGQTQFGLLRPDLTPRPGYVALAAVGRLLTDARPLGRVRPTAAGVHAYLFAARPDGEDRAVLVAWSSGEEATLPLPAQPLSICDHLGRVQPANDTRSASAAANSTARPAGAAPALALAAAPVYAVFAPEAAKAFDLDAPPPAPPRLPGEASPVVLQGMWPKERVNLRRSSYRVARDAPVDLTLYVYNFSGKPVRGALRAHAPDGWTARLPDGPVEVAPGDRAALTLSVTCGPGGPAPAGRVRVAGDFGPAGRPVLALNLEPDPRPLDPAAGTAVPGAQRPEAWAPEASGGTKITVSPDGAGLRVEAALGGGDRWAYPRLALPEGVRLPADAAGLQVRITLIEGEATFRAVVREAGGAGYAMDLLPQPTRGQAAEATAMFAEGVHGEGWSAPDPSGRLEAGEVRTIAVGCNVRSERVVFRLENLRWLPARQP
jgi:hypothetical protein